MQQPILVPMPVIATSSVPKETSRMQELDADSAVRRVCRGCSSSSQEPIQLGAQLQKRKKEGKEGKEQKEQTDDTFLLGIKLLK